MLEPNDPTASATLYPAQPVGVTRLSVNEIEGLCLKAARGAGFGWGLAEEAGFAAGWLAAQGIDGAALVLARLELAGGPEAPVGMMTLEAGVWRGEQGRVLCPIALGAALDDHAGLTGVEGASGPVAVPVLVVPFLARAARALGHGIAVRAGDAGLWIGAAGEIDPSDLQQFAKIAVAEIRIAPADRAASQAPLHAANVPGLRAETLSALNHLAMRITVPASAVSRRGAGTAGSDND